LMPMSLKSKSQAGPVRSRHVVLYDSECPLCAFQMKTLTWLDWFNRLSLAPISDPKASELAPNLSREELLEAIHCVDLEGRIHRGARCIRFVGMRLPLLIPVALFLWIPGIIWIAERIYMWISRNRHLLSRWFGCSDACAWMPSRTGHHQDGESAQPDFAPKNEKPTL
jgi:predicted DCC family thiol-disulfide oxidoreductase YuxK